MLVPWLFPALLILIKGFAVATQPEITPAPALPVRDLTTTPAQYYTSPSATHSIFSFNATSLSEKLPKPTCTQTITPDKNGYVPPGTCNSNYEYYPSFAAAVAVAVVFGVITILHILQAALYRKGFCWVVIMGALWELGGFVSRSASTRHQQSTGLVFISQIFILLAPICMINLPLQVRSVS
jgi:hypothetical protein